MERCFETFWCNVSLVAAFSILFYIFTSLNITFFTTLIIFLLIWFKLEFQIFWRIYRSGNKIPASRENGFSHLRTYHILTKDDFLSLVLPISHSYPFTKINKKEKVFACKEVSYFHKRETHTSKKFFIRKTFVFRTKKNISWISTCLKNTQTDYL